MRRPRLSQPLFKDQKTIDKTIYHFMRAYDIIWTLHFEPSDITPFDRQHNAIVVLDALGSIIENACGSGVFDSDPNQLSFEDEVLDNNEIRSAMSHNTKE